MNEFDSIHIRLPLNLLNLDCLVLAATKLLLQCITLHTQLVYLHRLMPYPLLVGIVILFVLLQQSIYGALVFHQLHLVLLKVLLRILQ